MAVGPDHGEVWYVGFVVDGRVLYGETQFFIEGRDSCLGMDIDPAGYKGKGIFHQELSELLAPVLLQDSDALKLGAFTGLPDPQGPHCLLPKQEEEVGTAIVLAIEVDGLVDALAFHEDASADSLALEQQRAVLALGCRTLLDKDQLCFHAAHTTAKRWFGASAYLIATLAPAVHGQAPLFSVALKGTRYHSMHIVIIGNGVAGATVAQKLAHKGVEVTLFAEEPYGFYSRIMLPHSLYDKEALAHLISKSDPPYLVKQPVTGIFPDRKEVETGDGKLYSYDKLVIATGSRSRTLEIFSNTEGVCTLRTFYDALLIGDIITSPVVVLGGGLLGLETALNLNNKGFDVTVCEAADRILVRQLDTVAATMLRSKLEEEGLTIRESTKTIGKRLDADAKLVALEVEGSPEIPCNTLILSLGVFPEVSLAREAGLRIKRGIVVDDYLRTSDEDIYAIGDCAEHNGQIPAIVPVALAMADTVIANLTGGDRVYEEPVLFTRFKDDALDVISVGDVTGIPLSKRVGERYEAYFLKEGTLAGAILYGSSEHLKFVRMNYQKLVSEGEIAALLDF